MTQLYDHEQFVRKIHPRGYKPRKTDDKREEIHTPFATDALVRKYILKKTCFSAKLKKL